MRKKYFLPIREGEIIVWLRNFANKLTKYASKYGITTEEVDYVDKAAEVLSWSADCIAIMEGSVSGFVAFKNDMLGKNRIKTSTFIVPTTPTFPTTPPIVDPDVLAHVLAMVNRIKAQLIYSVSDGIDMGIEGAQLIFDKDRAKPALVLKKIPKGVRISYKRGPAQGLSIYVRINGGERKFLINITRSSYEDERSREADDKPLVLEYCGLFMVGGKEVGQMSDPVTIII